LYIVLAISFLELFMQMCRGGEGAGMSVAEMSAATDMSVDGVSDESKGKEALYAFWTEHRLQHMEPSLRLYLGTETMADLDDVYPGDLNSLRTINWAEKTLTVAEFNRLHRAVKTHHAAKHAYPEPGVEHLPRCRACSCQNNGEALDTPLLMRRMTSHDVSSMG